MNAAPFPGNGMRTEDFNHLVGEVVEEAKMRDRKQDREESEELMQAALAEDLDKELPTQTLIGGNRGIFQRTIDAQRSEKAKQQAIASAAMAKARQLTVSIRSLEDALDSLLASEA
jgi:hypothetical protein